MFNKLKLGQKFSVLLALIFVGGAVGGGVIFSSLLNRSVEQQVTAKALILIESMNSVRNYTDTQVTPHLKNNAQFLPQSVPSYSAREVFEKFRKSPGYENFYYKDAVVNPTNPRDQADLFETSIVERFRIDSTLKELSGVRITDGFNAYWVARPIRITQTTCLVCHSRPEAAPASMVARYGKDRGFGWNLNVVLGVQLVSVPIESLRQEAWNNFLVLIGVMVAIFAVAILLVNFWLKRFVITPITQMAEAAEAASTGDLNVEFKATSEDEMGNLAAAFQRMKVSLTMAMKRIERGK